MVKNMLINTKRIIIISSILLLILICGCQKQNEPITGETILEQPNESTIITLDADGTFSLGECTKRGLNKVIMLESKYCGHCKKTLPIFKEACKEKGIEPIILDLAVGEQRKQMESYGVNIRFTPTFIFGCRYYVGTKSKEEYLKLLDEFVKNQP